MVEKILLKDIYSDCKDGIIRLYFPEEIDGVDPYRHTIVVCPGGGYNHTSRREGEILALKLLTMGCNAVVLDYTVGVGCYPYPMNELERTLDYLEDKNSLLQQEQLLGNSKATRLMDYITLYKALGGELWRKKFLLL